MKKRLIQMKEGESGVIGAIRGGWRMASRLDAMGVRPGKKFVVASRQPMWGPVAIEIDNFCVAIGYGMARRIMVEPISGK